MNERKKIGDILHAAGLISADQLSAALSRQAGGKARLGQVLIEMGIVDEEEVALVLSEQLQLPKVDLAAASVAADVLALLPRKFQEERQVVPVEAARDSLKLAMVDPLDYATIKDVQFFTARNVQPVVTTATQVDSFLRGSFPRSNGVKEALESIGPLEQIEVMAGEDVEGDEDILRLRKAGEAAPIVSIVNMILSEAVKAEASDVHLEPREKSFLVRYRIDGLLRDMTVLPIFAHQPVISRVKIMARMDISVRRRPQDGSTKIRMGDREVDLRISTLPTLYGEKMVVRILDRSRGMLSLDELGIQPADLAVFRRFLSRPQGMVLVTGPTGSGKTTTLYASLLHVRSEDVNIITIEDPVEYQIPGINQVHVNERAGVSFADGLRSMLRQDPNIIMVGEIRDRKTAEIAFQAALTGHLVLSTLHTNSAVAAVTRLVDIGVEPYLVASSVLGVVGQRLVRRSCPHCQVQYEPDPLVLEEARIGAPQAYDSVFIRGVGCERCGQTGYRGRTGIYEVMRMNDNLREMIVKRSSERSLLKAARAGGMCTMLEDGLHKAVNRLTTLEDVLRVAPPDEETAAASGGRAADGKPAGEERLSPPRF